MSTFCQEPASLIVTPGSVEKLLCCTTSWLAQADHLVTVCSESQVGKAMFGWAWQGVRSEKITNMTLEALEVLEKSKITELSFNDYRLKCWEGGGQGPGQLQQPEEDPLGVPWCASEAISYKVNPFCFPGDCVACTVLVPSNACVALRCVA